MIKRILSFLPIAALIFLTACGSEVDPQAELIKKVEKSTDKEILRTYCDDFNNDGKKEMFVLVGELSNDNQFESDIADGEVWYVSKNCSKRVDDDDNGIGILMTGENLEPSIIDYNNGKVFLFKSIWGNGENETTVCTATAENIIATEIPGSLQKGETDWYTTTSTYDITIKKEDFDSGKYYGSGRSRKRYWYYLDEESGCFREYGAKEITIDQFSNFDGAYDILESILPEDFSEIYNILYRENGIININMINYQRGNEYSCSNVLVGCDENRVWVIDNQHFSMPEDYHDSLYEGFYLTALTPKIANYPQDSFISVLPAEKPINLPAERYNSVYVPQKNEYVQLGDNSEVAYSVLGTCTVGGARSVRHAIRIYDESLMISYTDNEITSISYDRDEKNYEPNHEQSYKRKYIFLNNISLSTTEDEYKELYPKAKVEKRGEHSNGYTLYFVKDKNTGHYEADYSADAESYADFEFYCETDNGEITRIGIH